MTASHNSLIAAAAKANLGSLGFRQKGRSRLWIKDHGSWLNVVEFTPNRWSKGVNLMNAAHWLWAGTGFLSYNYAVPSNCHAEFENEDQFKNATENIARVAADKASQIEDLFASFESICVFVVDEARASERMRPSWFGYYAGIASGLENKITDATYFLSGLTDDRVTKHAADLLPLIKCPDDFKTAINERVAQQREKLLLPALNSDPF